MTTEKIRVYLADDHAMIRAGLAALIAKDDGIEVVGQAGDGPTVLKEVLALRPDVAVIDITMPGLNGLDVCREISRKASDIAVLILTMHNDEQFVASAVNSGAKGYLVKDAVADDFATAVRAVARGELYLSPGLSYSALDRPEGKDDTDTYESLTTREREVLQMIAEGKTNPQIADALSLSTKTIDTHRTHLMNKLDIHNQTLLVRYALRRGLIDHD